MRGRELAPADHPPITSPAGEDLPVPDAASSGVPSPGVPAPDVSVVVIVYNDAARLPAAVRSVLRQTLRNLEVIIVDDCSTDATPQVAEELARDPKVRYVRLERNSGGCSMPRNVGIGRARGAYVMFLDSDDTLDMHACMNMVQAAEETGADLVSGVCVRVHHNRSGLTETVPWWPEMYAERRVLDGVSQMPDLLRDTLSTNKCYRRDFLDANGLQFPVGYHYEDLLFSAKAYLAARRIALIPETVYHWNVVVRAAQKSISNRRGEISNVRDRISIHRMIDEALGAWLAAGGDPEVKISKDAKFVEHDLVLYLRDLPYQTPEYVAEFTELARDYLGTLHPEAFARCPHRVAVAGAYLLLQRDWPNLVTVCEHLLDRSRDSAKHLERTRITSDLAERDGRIYWCAQHLDSAEGRAALDVTDLGLHRAGFAQANLAARATSLEALGGGRVRISGESVNPLGRIPADATLTAALEFRPSARAVRTYKAKVGEVRHSADHAGHIAWTAEVNVTKLVRPVGVIDQNWEVRLRLTAANLGTSTSKVTALPDVPGVGEAPLTLRARPLLTRAVGDEWVAGINHRGLLGFTLVARNPVARTLTAPFEQATAGQRSDKPGSNTSNKPGGGGRVLRLAQKLYRRSRIINDPRIKREVYRKVLVRLPLRRGSVVFESHLGGSYSDSPKYIHEALRRSGYKGRVTWSYAKSTAGFPRDAVLVERGSWKYLRALARAEFWIDNQGFPQWIGKRSGTTYVQTWHGTALKKMGANTPQVKAMLAADRKRLAAAVGRFDHFLVRAEYDIKTLVEAFGLRAEPLRIGYPRNDLLLAPDRDQRGAALREKLGLPADRTLVLYAPTFRATAGVFEPGFDLEAFAAALGDTHLLLVRAHYLNTVDVPRPAGDAVRDVSAHPDITELMLVSDVLVTDYSSVMFDYALLDRPMVFFAPDAQDYSKDRGTYFDLADRAPGPITADQDAFFDAIRAAAGPATEDHYAEARKAFAHDFGEYETGSAAEQIVARFFAGKGGTR
ncbi:MAG TPA: CDP-glycerol glycerophosphotransferase family protein [Actinocrinis sp.]|nr:CDP-glycerol glycerophosphotransferase family protein [Actinocrinis sp.]